MLLGVAVTDDRLLDESRTVFVNLQMSAFGDEQGDPTHLPELERDLDVGRVEGLFNRTRIGLETRDHGFAPAPDFKKPHREALARRGLYRAVFDQAITPPIALDDAPARRLT